MIEFQIELSDQPGQLAGVTEAIALGGANILGAAAIGKARPAVALVVDDESATMKALDDYGASYSTNELLLYTLLSKRVALTPSANSPSKDTEGNLGSLGAFIIF